MIWSKKREFPDGSGSVAPVFNVIFAPKNFGFQNLEREFCLPCYFRLSLAVCNGSDRKS